MALTPEQLAKIRRDLDRDLEERMARPRHMPQPREPEQTAAQRKKLPAAAWNAWADSLIDSRLAAFKDGVGGALAQVRRELVKRFETEIADLRAELAEVKGRVAAAESKALPLATAEPRTAPPRALAPPHWAGTA